MTATSSRTFRAADARSALSAVKAALGAEAVILSTREISNGLFRSKEIEVTAMVDAPLASAPSQGTGPVYGSLAKELGQARAEPKPAANPLASELAELRRTMADLQRQMTDAAREQALEREPSRLLPTHALQMLERLEVRGVEAAVARELVDQAARTVEAPGAAAFLQSLREQLSQRLVPGRAPWQRDGRRVMALVGPTGVGKTTTLAKIAARALLESRLKISLITVDTYRVGASDQVCRYGSIMKVPTFVARDVAALKKAMLDSADADLVLIDTAGRSVNEVVAKQAELLRSIPEVQLNLVLSAATGARDLAATTERYRALSPDRLIFTKMDEAAAPGGLLSATARLEKPICAVADGQRVPEDIHCFTSTELMDWVVGLNESPDPFYAQPATAREVR